MFPPYNSVFYVIVQCFKWPHESNMSVLYQVLHFSCVLLFCLYGHPSSQDRRHRSTDCGELGEHNPWQLCWTRSRQGKLDQLPRNMGGAPPSWSIEVQLLNLRIKWKGYRGLGSHPGKKCLPCGDIAKGESRHKDFQGSSLQPFPLLFQPFWVQGEKERQNALHPEIQYLDPPPLAMPPQGRHQQQSLGQDLGFAAFTFKAWRSLDLLGDLII